MTPCCILVVVVTLWSSLGVDGQMRTEAMSGVYLSEVPQLSSRVYSGYAPIVYGFEVPIWTPTDLGINLGSNCTSSNWTEGTTCPVKYFMPLVQDRLKSYILGEQPFGSRLRGTNAQTEEILFDCYSIMKHFQDFYIDATVLGTYLEQLKKCSVAADQDFFEHISSYKHNVSGVYWEMRHGFFTEYWMKVHDGRIDAGLWNNNLNVIHALQFLNFGMEVDRWRFAQRDCEAGRVPSSLVTPELLQDTLEELMPTLALRGLQLVLNPQEIANYFKAQLADCAFTTNGTLFVRILVPTITKQNKYKAMRLIPIKFKTSSGKLCSVGSDRLILVDLARKLGFVSGCAAGDDLCRLVANPSQIDSCGTAIVNADLKNILIHCPFTCAPISPYLNNLNSTFSTTQFDVKSVGGGKFIVISFGSYQNGGERMILECPKSNTTLNIGELGSVGAVEITLPCQCRLRSQYEKWESSQSSCSSTPRPQIVRIIPLQWVNEGTIKSFQGGSSRYPVASTDFDSVRSSSDEGNARADASKDVQQEVGISGGIKFILTLYFFTLLILLILVAFLLYRMKGLGVSLNPLKVASSTATSSIHYENMQNNSLLSDQ